MGKNEKNGNNGKNRNNMYNFCASSTNGFRYRTDILGCENGIDR